MTHIRIQDQSLNLPQNLMEHFSAIEIESPAEIMNMEHPTFQDKEIKQALKALKNNKAAAGPDNMRGELFKILADSNIFVSTLRNCFDKTLTDGQTPQNWKFSKTVMLEKKTKPTVSDLRPISLLNTSYKLFMAILRSKIDHHIHRNQQDNELQAGFTKKRRIEDNLFLLNYCVEQSFKMKKPLITISIDFKKAFDSIKRKSLITCMKKFKIHPLIIDIISEIYKNDKVTLYLNNEIMANINVTSGIRQGCNGSTSLFLLLTYIIILHLNQAQAGFRDEICFIPALFYADDGLILAQSEQQAQHMLEVLTDSAHACGLEINKNKSFVMIYNHITNADNLHGINIVNEIKYLGVNITNKRRCFANYKKEKINEARKLSNITAAVVAKSSNRLLIGKTYWKQVALPKFLYCQSVIPYTENEIEQLQKEENKAFRTILRVPKYTPNCFLKGEIGSSHMKSRDAKAKLLYVRHMMTHSNNDLLKHCLLHSLENAKDRWTKSVNKYLQALNINIHRLGHVTQQRIIESLKEKDTQSWRNELQEKDSLTLYRTYKPDIKEIDFYENDEATTLLIRCRSNTLKTNYRNRHTDGNTHCTKCDTHEDETLEHFLLHCETYTPIRQSLPFLTDNTITNEDKLAKLLLLTDQHDINIKKEVLLQMWRKRSS